MDSASDLVWCRPYALGDLALMTPRADMAAEIAALGRDAHDRSFVGWTLLAGEGAQSAVLACAWLEWIGDGRYSLAACVSDMTRRQWAHASMFVRDKLKRLDAALAPKAVIATCRADMPKACAFLVQHGFALDLTAPPPAPGYLTMTRSA